MKTLKAENEKLKKEIETLMGKLKSFEEEKEEEKEAKIKSVVTEAIKAGKIKAELAEQFTLFGRYNFEAMNATIAGIQVKYEPLDAVPAKKTPVATRQAAWEAYKKNEISMNQYLETIKTMEG